MALGGWLLVRDREPSPGPLAVDNSDRLGWPQPAGVPFGYGLAVAFNDGKAPAVLERIAPVEVPPGLKVLASYAAGPQRKYLAVDYRVGDTRHHVELHAGLRVCATPPGKRPRHPDCDAPGAAPGAV